MSRQCPVRGGSNRGVQDLPDRGGLLHGALHARVAQAQQQRAAVAALHADGARAHVAQVYRRVQ